MKQQWLHKQTVNFNYFGQGLTNRVLTIIKEQIKTIKNDYTIEKDRQGIDEEHSQCIIELDYSEGLYHRKGIDQDLRQGLESDYILDKEYNQTIYKEQNKSIYKEYNKNRKDYRQGIGVDNRQGTELNKEYT